LNIFSEIPGLWVVVLGTSLLGFICGMTGCFAVLRKQSLIGDAVSHAALPGVVGGYILFQSKETWALLAGAFLSGLIATYLADWITRNSKIKSDSAQAILLSVFFGIGLVLLTWLQKQPNAAQAGLTRFLFGQASTLLMGDFLTLLVLIFPVLIVVIAFWKEFKIVCFDRPYAVSIGLPVFWLEQLILVLQVVVIVAGLEIVGVVLMSALLIAPAVAARQWTNRLGYMVILAGFIGAISGVSGSIIANMIRKSLPTGPVIVLVVSIIVVFSILFANERGFLWRYISFLKKRRKTNLESDLRSLVQLSVSHSGRHEGHSLALIQKASMNPPGAASSMKVLVQMGLVRETIKNHFLPTSKAEEFLGQKTQGNSPP